MNFFVENMNLNFSKEVSKWLDLPVQRIKIGFYLAIQNKTFLNMCTFLFLSLEFHMALLLLAIGISDSYGLKELAETPEEVKQNKCLFERSIIKVAL